jgi:hypothetical protein
VPRKEEEIHYVRLLLSRLDMPGAEPIPSEGPDFLVDRGGYILGIEATGLVRRSDSDGDLKLREQFQRQVVRAAEQVYDASGGPGVWVDVRWLPWVVKGDPQFLATELARFVAGNLPDVGPSGWAWTYIDFRKLPDTLQAQLRGVTIHRNRPGTARGWGFGYVTYPDVAPAELQGEIIRKEARAAKYEKRYEDLWLLIYATGQGKPEWVEVSDNAQQVLYPTLFDRVFFLDAREQLLELAVVHTVSLPASTKT